MLDNINNPNHYKIDGANIETIEIIKESLGDEFLSFCKGNILKYLIRAEKKNGIEDYKKACKYLEWAIEESKKYEIVNFNAEQISSQLGLEWLDVISGICRSIDIKKALLLEKTIDNVFIENYEKAKEYLEKIIMEG